MYPHPPTGNGLRRAISALTITVASALPITSFAANGYFLNGYSANGRAVSGAGVAAATEPMSIAVNPASIARLPGDGWQVGVTLLGGIGGPELRIGEAPIPQGGPPPGSVPLRPGTYEHDPQTPNQVGGVFPVPNGAITWKLDDSSAFGIAVYGNGGLNNTYQSFDNDTCPANTPQRGLLCFGDVASDIAQTFVAPTYAWEPTPNLYLGASLMLAWQVIEIRGLNLFRPQSRAPSKVSNNGHDNAFGVGAKLGAQAVVTPTLRVGLAYQTETFSTKFDEYAGLLAEQGSFNAPPQMQVGIAWDVAAKWTVLADILRIEYEEINSLSNLQDAPGRLGDDNGPGFGWQNVNSYKLGAIYRASPNWTFRFGYSHNDTPVRSDHLLFNILALASFENHFNAGVSYDWSQRYSIDVSATATTRDSIEGPNFLYPQQRIQGDNALYSLDIAWRRRFH